MMTSAATIIAALGGNSRTGMCRCPAHDDKTPSLSVSNGDRGVLVKCHAGCSQEDVIAELKRQNLWQKRNRVQLRPARVRVRLRPTRVRLHPLANAETSGTEQIAMELADAAGESDEHPTAYLRQRGISTPPSVLKLVGAGVMHFITGTMLPAMIAPITGKDGRIIGVHVTYLMTDAKDNAVGKHGKVRRMYGEVGGGSVVLKPADPERPFILGEGVETVLSAMEITGLPGAAALSATNLPKIDPPKCSEVIIAADADEPGIKAAEQLADRLVTAGYKVRIATPTTTGNDWNDELKTHGDTEELKRQLIEAPLYEPRADDDEDTFLPAVKPWHGSVDGAALLDELVDVFNRHMDLPKSAAETLALWVMHSHAHDSAQHSPILFISSPTKRCGKTNLLSVLHLLVPKPLSAANVTPATVFRSINLWKPTMLIDEADTFISEKSELRGVLNSGHRRSQAYILRCVGDDNTPKPFSTWSPKAFAGIGRLPSTLEDRSIIIELRRKLKTVRVERVPVRDDAYDELRRKAARWAEDHMARLEQADPKVPSALSDRACDNWTPLLAIAEIAGGEWPDRAASSARQLSSRDDDEGEAEMLLQDLRAIFSGEDAEAMWTEAIIEALIEIEGRPWVDLTRGRPINAHTLARFLKPFHVFPRKMRIDGSRQKRSGYERKRLEPVWQRYIDGEGVRK